MSDFVNCTREQLKAQGFGKKKADDLVKRFEGLREGYVFEGADSISAGARAQDQLFKEMRAAKIDKLRAANIQAQQYADGVARMDAVLASGKSANRIADAGYHTKGALLGSAIMSKWVDDPRMKGASWEGMRRSVYSNLVGLLHEGLDKYGKGIFGRQMGAEDIPSIIRATGGDFSGKPEAVAFGRSLSDAANAGVAWLRKVGGERGSLDNFMPNPMTSKAKILKAQQEGWLLDFVKENADLAKMRRPDGRPLPLNDVAELNKVLTEALDTKVFGDLDVSGGHGAGAGQHRFFHWKDGDAWLRVHEKFGEGNPIDTWYDHLHGLADEIAMVSTVGRNPTQTLNSLISEGRKKAKVLGKAEFDEFNSYVENKIKIVNDILKGTVVPNPQDKLLLGFGIVSNVTRAALLKAASLITTPTDPMTLAFTRSLNKMGGFADSLVAAKLMIGASKDEVRQFLRESGYVRDAVTARFGGRDRFGSAVLMENMPRWAQGLSDGVMRANGMTAITEATREWGLRTFLIEGGRWVGKTWDEMKDFHVVFDHYGITEKMWNDITPYLKATEPARHAGVKLLDTKGLREAGLVDEHLKITNMFMQEAINGVPESSADVRAMLNLGKRPDTLAGVFLNSFAMFKAMAFQVPMLLAKQLIAREGSQLTRAKYVGTILAGLTLAGALRLQIQELTMNNRTPRQMDAAFWTRAAMAGGGFGFLGDVVFGAADSVKGRGLNDIIAGAAMTPVGSAINLGGTAVKEAVAFANGEESGDKALADTGHAAVQFLKQNTPGTFYTYALVNGAMYDALDEMVDPVGYGKRQMQKERMARRQKGNEPLQFR